MEVVTPEQQASIRALLAHHRELAEQHEDDHARASWHAGFASALLVVQLISDGPTDSHGWPVGMF